MVVVTYIPVQATPNWLQGSWLLPAFILLTSIDLNSRKERISPGWNIFNLTISPLLENNLLKNLSLFCGFYGVFFFFEFCPKIYRLTVNHNSINQQDHEIHSAGDQNSAVSEVNPLYVFKFQATRSIQSVSFLGALYYVMLSLRAITVRYWPLTSARFQADFII